MTPIYYGIGSRLFFHVEAKEVFSIFSIQGGGAGLNIPTSKVGDCLRAIGHFPSQAQIKETEKILDPSSSIWSILISRFRMGQ